MKTLQTRKLVQLEGGSLVPNSSRCPKGLIPIAITHVWLPGWGPANIICGKPFDFILRA